MAPPSQQGQCVKVAVRCILHRTVQVRTDKGPILWGCSSWELQEKQPSWQRYSVLCTSTGTVWLTVWRTKAGDLSSEDVKRATRLNSVLWRWESPAWETIHMWIFLLCFKKRVGRKGPETYFLSGVNSLLALPMRYKFHNLSPYVKKKNSWAMCKMELMFEAISLFP